jgi:hypothetical protein
MKASLLAASVVLCVTGLLPIEVLAEVEVKPSREALNAVVRIDNVYSNPDFFVPWQNRIQELSIGSGVVISGRRILTNQPRMTTNDTH